MDCRFLIRSGSTTFLARPEARPAAAQTGNASAYVAPQGEYVQEPVPVEEPIASRSNIPTGAIVLIVIGLAFLFDNLGIIHFHWIGRMWPLILIALGLNMFIRRGYFSRH